MCVSISVVALRVYEINAEHLAQSIPRDLLKRRISHVPNLTACQITNLTRIKTLKKEAKKDPEMSANIEIIAKVTRIFLAN